MALRQVSTGHKNRIIKIKIYCLELYTVNQKSKIVITVFEDMFQKWV